MADIEKITADISALILELFDHDMPASSSLRGAQIAAALPYIKGAWLYFVLGHLTADHKLTMPDGYDSRLDAADQRWRLA